MSVPFVHLDFTKKARPMALPDAPGLPAAARHASAAEVGANGNIPAHEAPFNLLMLRDYAIEIVTALWSEPTSFLFPEQSARIAFNRLPAEPAAKAEAQKNGIYVTSAQAWNPASPDFLPAIYVSVGDGTLAAPSGSGMKQAATNYLTESAETDYETRASGTIRFVHEAMTEVEALAIMSNTLDMLTAFAPVIRRDWCMQIFDVAGWSVPVPVNTDAKPSRFKSVITCAYSKSQKWTLRQAAPRLKRLQFLTSLHTP